MFESMLSGSGGGGGGGSSYQSGADTTNRTSQNTTATNRNGSQYNIGSDNPFPSWMTGESGLTKWLPLVVVAGIALVVWKLKKSA